MSDENKLSQDESPKDEDESPGKSGIVSSEKSSEIGSSEDDALLDNGQPKITDENEKSSPDEPPKDEDESSDKNEIVPPEKSSESVTSEDHSDIGKAKMTDENEKSAQDEPPKDEDESGSVSSEKSPESSITEDDFLIDNGKPKMTDENETSSLDEPPKDEDESSLSPEVMGLRLIERLAAELNTKMTSPEVMGLQLIQRLAAQVNTKMTSPEVMGLQLIQRLAAQVNAKLNQPPKDEDESSDKSGIVSSEESSGRATSSDIGKAKMTDEDESSTDEDESSDGSSGSGSSEDYSSEESSEQSPERIRTEDDYRLRNIFHRPTHQTPRHPILSSAFARHIAIRAFGPKKPKWYTALTSAQLYLFKDIMNYVEIGRRGSFRFDDFIEALQDFDPDISREEVVSILDGMEKNEFEELDYGKFLFLLAYGDPAQDVEDPGGIDRMLSTSFVTPRQCLLLSAISYFVLIASPEEIERYYVGNTRRKATVLHYHMEATRLVGLTEKQMEEKQKKARQHLGPLFALTGSPYACPVPFVPSSKKRKIRPPEPRLAMKKKPIPRPITPIKQPRDLGDPVRYETQDDKTFYDMHYGRLPMPRMSIPEKIREEMRKRCTVIHKEYITRKSYQAKDKYIERRKRATVLYNKRSLDIILKKGFPSDKERKDFIELYKVYMPMKVEDVKNYSLWVRPAGYEFKHDGKPLYPDKFAFGSKIP